MKLHKTFIILTKGLCLYGNMLGPTNGKLDRKMDTMTYVFRTKKVLMFFSSCHWMLKKLFSRLEYLKVRGHLLHEVVHYSSAYSRFGSMN